MKDSKSNKNMFGMDKNMVNWWYNLTEEQQDNYRDKHSLKEPLSVMDIEEIWKKERKRKYK